jgi:hypothetical protein
MTNNEALAKTFIKELVNRVSRYMVVVYDIESNRFSFREIFAQSDELEKFPWITRTQSAAAGESLQDALWNIKWSLKDVL